MELGGRSRLDRLIGLLHTGKEEAARLAAARQIGEIQRARPEQLHQLLQRILALLFSNDWETRRAATAALEAVAEAVPEWEPAHPAEADVSAEDTARREAEGAWLQFGSFDMGRVLQFGKPLLASGGQEFELDATGEKPR